MVGAIASMFSKEYLPILRQFNTSSVQERKFPFKVTCTCNTAVSLQEKSPGDELAAYQARSRLLDSEREGGGGLLPFLRYIGICGAKGHGFEPSW